MEEGGSHIWSGTVVSPGHCLSIPSFSGHLLADRCLFSPFALLSSTRSFLRSMLRTSAALGWITVLGHTGPFGEQVVRMEAAGTFAGYLCGCHLIPPPLSPSFGHSNFRLSVAGAIVTARPSIVFGQSRGCISNTSHSSYVSLRAELESDPLNELATP